VERPSRHAMLGVRNGEIVGDTGGREDVNRLIAPVLPWSSSQKTEAVATHGRSHLSCAEHPGSW
jgi:hypothetical protein